MNKFSVMSHNNFWTLFILLSVFSCREPAAKAINKIDISDAVRLTLNNYFADVRKEGLLGEFKYLDSSLDFFWVPPGYTSSISYDSVASILKRYQSFYTSIENSWELLVIRPLTNDLASYSGRIRSLVTDTSGIRKDITLVETGLVIRRQEGWKLLNGQTSVVEDRADQKARTANGSL